MLSCEVQYSHDLDAWKHVPESKEAVYQHLHWLVVSLATWVTNKCLDHILLLNLKAIVTGLRYNCVTYILGAHPV